MKADAGSGKKGTKERTKKRMDGAHVQVFFVAKRQ